MNYDCRYRDGWTDPVNGQILTYDGVTNVENPKLTWLSENVGEQLLKAGYNLDQFLRPNPMLKSEFDPSPRMSRVLGATCLTLSSVALATKIGLEAKEVIASVGGIAEDILNSYIFKPLASLSTKYFFK